MPNSRGNKSGQNPGVQVNNVFTTPPVAISIQQKNTPFIVRAIWFILFGWWLSGIAISIAIALLFPIITVPLSIWIMHRVPQIQTLRDRSREFETQVVGGSIFMSEGTVAQRPFLLRALWFLLIGIWLAPLWLTVAWLISLTIILLPISIIMIDRTPGILTLQKH